MVNKREQKEIGVNISKENNPRPGKISGKFSLTFKIV